MSGLPIDEEDPVILKNTIENFAKQKLSVDVKGKSVIKLEPRTCFIQFNDEYDKEKVMQNKNKLKDSKYIRVYTNNDLTKMERLKQKRMRDIARKETQKGNVVKIGYNKITINEEEWRWDNNESGIKKINPKNLRKKKNKI